jgi:hypothetical protein
MHPKELDFIVNILNSQIETLKYIIDQSLEQCQNKEAPVGIFLSFQRISKHIDDVQEEINHMARMVIAMPRNKRE